LADAGDTVVGVRVCSIRGALAILAIATSSALASPLVVVVRGSGDELAVVRLRGQVADLDVELTLAPGALEPALDAQLATAARLAEAHDARVVVWFVARAGGGGAVAIAMPADHRLFVRELPRGAASALAEAEAVAARGALQAIAAGGTIGIAVEPKATSTVASTDERVAVPAPPPAPGFGIEAAVGGQVAIDGGADRGAYAIAQRTTLARDAWAGSLSLALGVPGTRAGTTEVELARSGGALGIERRFGAFAIGVEAGAVIYRRSTVATPTDLAATRASTTVAFAAGPEVRYRWQPGSIAIGLDLTAGVDLVAGAPELAVARGTEIDSLGKLWSVQPRVMLGLFARSR
jgi:hypothetical protein